MARRRNGVNISTNEDNFESVVNAVRDLSRYSVEVGIFASDDSFYAMIANVHEFGMKIEPKGQFLTIPKPAAEGRKASEIPGLFRPKGKNILAVKDGDGIKIMFVLVESVTIPERSFVRSTFDENESDWGQFMEGMIEKVVSLQMDARTLFEQLGARIAADIQEKITTLRSPENAGITKENKGSSNPLMDTGGLRSRVTWKVVEGNA
ncbi:hypothetical protein [Priestia filamentosa]|uniref:hypothetical protein n=1 Tax=Priestia filamentosa TaxID=1402861 RepID=UPI003982ADCF